ncbi:MAG: hypothetical protein MZW92_09460 [Comamonadaceae bacterium]|nr:hypothetical protein [Comamonadaceae bacterium]
MKRASAQGGISRWPASGRGLRRRPRPVPGEMLPIVDKPLIQYGVEEVVAAGVDNLVFIIGRTKNAIADHFDKAYELEVELEMRGRTRSAPDGAQHRPVRRGMRLRPPGRGAGPGPCGAMRPAGGGRRTVRGDPGRRPDRGGCPGGRGAEPDGSANCTSTSVRSWAWSGCPRQETHKYGIVHPLPFANRLSNVDGIVEKPKPGERALRSGGGGPLHPDPAHLRPAGTTSRAGPATKSSSPTASPRC